MTLATGPAVLSMVTGSTSSSRSFSIKVCQIECTQINKGDISITYVIIQPISCMYIQCTYILCKVYMYNVHTV
jgi:hypothetical protein